MLHTTASSIEKLAPNVSFSYSAAINKWRTVYRAGSRPPRGSG